MAELSSEHNGTLLLLDDEINITNSLKRILVPLKYTVLTACNGYEGLELLENNHVDVIISDMRMPEMDGAEFLKIASEKWPDVRRILLTGYADINSAVSAINNGKVDYYLHKPWQQKELEIIIKNTMDKRHLIEENNRLQVFLTMKNEELLFLNNNLENIVSERTLDLENAYQDIENSYQSVVQILSTLSEQNESNTKGYLQRVAKVSKILAEKIGLSEAEAQTIHTAALLHTIGKIGLADAIISKPYKLLTHSERAQFEKYPVLGSTILMRFPSLEKVASLIVAHRESLDGSGYPNKLSGEAIPFGARLLSLVIDYHQMQLGLLTHEKMSANQALQYIRNNTNKCYDTSIIDFFCDVIKALPEEQSQLDETVINAAELKKGMVLARDLITKNGLQLLPCGYVLSEACISAINQVGNISLYVVTDSIGETKEQ